MSQLLAVAPVTVSATGTLSVTSAALGGYSATSVAMCFSAGHNPANDPGETLDARFAVALGLDAGWTYSSISPQYAAHAGFPRSWASRLKNASNPPNDLSAASGADIYNFFAVYNTIDNPGAPYDAYGNWQFGDTTSGGIVLGTTLSTGKGPYRGFALLLPLFDGGAHFSQFAIALGGTTGQFMVDCGFEPDIIFTSLNGALGNLSASAFNQTFGIACRDGLGIAQKSVSFIQAAGASAACHQYVSSSQVLAIQSASTLALEAAGQVNSFAAGQGFWMQANPASAAADTFYALALKLPQGASAKVFDFSTPSATGHTSVTGIGFKPQLVLLIGTFMTARDTSVSTIDQACGWAAGAFDGFDQWSANFRIQGGSPAANCGCISSNHALCIARGASNSAIVADFVSMDADGFTLNYTATDATPRVGFGIAIAGASTGPTTSNARGRISIWGQWPPAV